MQHNTIIPTKPIPHHKLTKQIQHFNFFLQYPHFKHINHYKHPHISYNPNLPTYSPKYQFTNHHYNLQHLTKTYHIPTKQPPKILLKPHPHLKPSSLPSKHLQFTFLQNKKQNIYFSHTINFKPTQ
ncbi:Csa1 family protein [Staphylococcus aureus]|uniref:Csa1 family protein n=1 Tax=Staphylococcus aureus TaxID=1280 RepID=UPI0028CB17DA|nr:Csa1 family protein [Staphylococcus aureus]